MLTNRETQIASLVASGEQDKDIVAILGIGVETVGAHMKNIYRKLNLKTGNSRVKLTR